MVTVSDIHTWSRSHVTHKSEILIIADRAIDLLLAVFRAMFQF